MKTYYLIDFENVFSKGLTGCSQLRKKDHIIVFYTNHTKTIDLDIICEHGKADLRFYKVHDGKQSLDMHIVSYIGYIIGKNKSKDIEIIIVDDNSESKNPVEKQVDEKAELKKKIQEPLRKEGVAVDRINGVTSVVVKNLGKTDSKQKIYRGIISKYGQEVGLYLYRLIKDQL